MALYQNGNFFKVLFQPTFLVETLKKHIEKQYLKGKIKCPDSPQSTPCSFCLEIKSRTDLAPQAKLSFGTLGQRQRKIFW